MLTLKFYRLDEKEIFEEAIEEKIEKLEKRLAELDTIKRPGIYAREQIKITKDRLHVARTILHQILQVKGSVDVS